MGYWLGKHTTNHSGEQISVVAQTVNALVASPIEALPLAVIVDVDVVYSRVNG